MRPTDRRSFLKTMSTLTVGSTFGSWAKATEYSLGSANVICLSDGMMQLPFSNLLAEAENPEKQRFLETHNIDTEQHSSPLNLTLLRDGENTVLFDIGAGSNFLPGTGLLIDSLDELGIAAEEITHVVFTHAHPDHLWGLMDDFDDPLMPNAEYLISATEWDYWVDPNTVDTMPEDRLAFAVGAKRHLLSIEDKITRFKNGEEILPGIEAVATHGHTPGHTAFELRKGSESMMVVGDALTHEHISFARPDWHTGTDQDRATGAATRVKLLDRLQHQQTPIIGYHLPNGGLGMVESAGSSYRFTAMPG